MTIIATTEVKPSVVLLPQELSNEELREQYGEPCDHSNGSHVEYGDGIYEPSLVVYECHDCGLVC